MTVRLKTYTSFGAMLLAGSTMFMSLPAAAWVDKAKAPVARAASTHDAVGHVVAAQDDALRFANAYLPDALIMEQMNVNFTRGFESQIKGNPSIDAMEKQFPGSKAVMMNAGREYMEKEMQRILPVLRAELADFVRAKIPADQQGALADYMMSPAGQKTIVHAGRAVDPAQLIEKDADGRLRLKFDKDSLAAATDYRFLAELTPEELAELTRFSASPAGRSFEAQAPAMIDLIGEQTRRFIDEIVPGTGNAVAQALRAHMLASAPQQQKK